MITKRLGEILGLEESVLASLAQRLWQLGSAPLTLLLVAACFSP